jgi:gas vesicle protein
MTTGRYESDSSNVGTAVTFLLIGLGAGTLLGMLLAPKTGKQLRRDLRRGYEEARENLGEWAEDAKDRVREAGDRVRDAAARGAEFADDLRERVEPFRKAINRS